MPQHSFEFWEYEKHQMDKFLEETVQHLGPIFQKHRLTLNQGILIYVQLQLQTSVEDLLDKLNERLDRSNPDFGA